VGVRYMPSEILPRSQAVSRCGRGSVESKNATQLCGRMAFGGVGESCEGYFPSACAFKASNVFADVIILCTAAVSTKLYCGFFAKASAMS
jgi:hypothetical protein